MIVEGDKYATLHNYWLTLREMKIQLMIIRSDTDVVKSMKTAGTRYIERSEDAGSFQLSIRHKMAVFLHPLLKGLSFASADDKKEIHDHAKTMIELQNERTTTEAAAANVQSDTSQPSTSTTSLFQGYFDVYNDNCDNSNNNNELERYIVSKIEPVMIN